MQDDQIETLCEAIRTVSPHDDSLSIRATARAILPTLLKVHHPTMAIDESLQIAIQFEQRAKQMVDVDYLDLD